MGDCLLREHGGQVLDASRMFGIPVADWLDLSTGIAPWVYPVPDLPAAVWQRLPEDDDGLIGAACEYYQAMHLLPVPGSQAAIMALPRLFSSRRVAVLSPGYGEYPAAWQVAGHVVNLVSSERVLSADNEADVVMLANPNNPDGMVFQKSRLLGMAQRLWATRRWLIIDEAFADADDQQSLAKLAGSPKAPNVIVLRSLGKFFGLAGARVGFCIARPDMLVRLQRQIGPWSVSHPARAVARVALADAAWHHIQKRALHEASSRLAAMLLAHGMTPHGGTALFQYVRHSQASSFAEIFARQGILVRCFTNPAALRFGLPGNEADWQRLATALKSLSPA